MKEQILKTIYDIFAVWSRDFDIACCPGCSACCTRNVTMTAVEGELILRYIREKKLEHQFAERLQSARPPKRPKMTTNDFARACLQKKTYDFAEPSPEEKCPFLEDNLCIIYQVRPFACRMMISRHRCGEGHAALLSDDYLAAATAVMQIIEHLGQKEYWGNMLDILPALCDISEHHAIASCLDKVMMMEARMGTLTAKPLPGFLFTEKEEHTVAPLLQTIFNTEISARRIEDILNGR
ncbi:YkgJ family cysteine cluster protein [Desulfomarina sp.]